MSEKQNEFLERLGEALSLDETPNLAAVLCENDGWDSVGHLSTMVIIDELFDVTINAEKLRECNSPQEIISLIGSS